MFLGKLFSFRKVQIFFRGFRNRSCQSVDSQKKMFATVAKTAFCVAKESFLMKKNKFVRKIVTSTFLEIGKVFRFFGNKVTAGLPKFKCACSDEHFEEKKLCLESAQVFHPFRSSSKKFSEFWRESYWRGGHNWILRVEMKIFLFFEGRNWRKNWFFRKKLRCYPFETLRQKDSPYFWRHYYGRLVKNSLYMFRRRFLKIIFLEGLLVFPHFWKFSKKTSEFWREIFGRVVTTAFYMYIGRFLRKFFSFRKVQFFFVVFGIWAANLWIVRENCLLPLPKLHSALLKNHFWWKKINLFEKL